MSLFAQMDIEQVVWLVMVILFFIGPAVWKIISAAGAQERKAPPAAQPGQPRQQQPRPAPAEADDEISQFLRAAAGRRNQAQQKEGRRRETRQQQPRQRTTTRRKGRPVEVPAEAVVVDQQSVGGHVSEHVNQYLSRDEFGQRAEQLGQKVSRTDQRVEEHRREVFDHRVGTLAAGTKQTPAEENAAEQFPLTTAAGLAALLADTNSIRQAIVINEILTPPEDRWA